MVKVRAGVGGERLPWNVGGGRRGGGDPRGAPGSHPPLARIERDVRLPTKLGHASRPVATITRTSYYLRRRVTRSRSGRGRPPGAMPGRPVGWGARSRRQRQPWCG